MTAPTYTRADVERTVRHYDRFGMFSTSDEEIIADLARRVLALQPPSEVAVLNAEEAVYHETGGAYFSDGAEWGFRAAVAALLGEGE